MNNLTIFRKLNATRLLFETFIIKAILNLSFNIFVIGPGLGLDLHLYGLV